MSIYLLFGGFKWLKNVDGFYLNSMSKKSPIGYILEVDLEHPDELHVLRNDYPLASEKFAISYDRCHIIVNMKSQANMKEKLVM